MKINGEKELFVYVLRRTNIYWPVNPGLQTHWPSTHCPSAPQLHWSTKLSFIFLFSFTQTYSPLFDKTQNPLCFENSKIFKLFPAVTFYRKTNYPGMCKCNFEKACRTRTVRLVHNFCGWLGRNLINKYIAQKFWNFSHLRDCKYWIHPPENRASIHKNTVQIGHRHNVHLSDS